MAKITAIKSNILYFVSSVCDVLATGMINNISLKFIDPIRGGYAMVASDIKNVCSINDYAGFCHSRFTTITTSSDDADAQNLNDTNDIYSDNNNSSDRTRNVALQQNLMQVIKNSV